MLLAELVETAAAVAATPARGAKAALLAGLLSRLAPDELAAATALLSGEPRQGRIGVGWATLSSLDVAPAERAVLEIADLDRALTAIQATTGPGSVASRGRLLAGLLGRATGHETDFVRRLLVGDVRQGALEGVMTEAVARAADVPAAAVRRALMLRGDLGRVAEVALRDGAEGLAAVGLEILRPLQPMLATTAGDVAAALAGTGPASVEWKLDGIRIQAHRRGDEIRVFTRNLNDATARVPEVVEIVRQMPADRLVLDGEALALDEHDRARLFQDTIKRLGGRAERPAGAVTAWFFDCLHVDGADLIDRPLAERLQELERVAGRWRMPSLITADPAAAEVFLQDALAAGHEGVMVKSMASVYQAGRRGKAWIKLKPSLTLDLVVLAVEWGHGRRRGWLSNLHLGARDSAGGFVMVGKTFKGLTDEMLRWQTARLLELEDRREGITVHVRPEIVVEISLDGVQISSRYPGGVALRFARVKRYREDKDPADADTIDAVRGFLSRTP